MKVFLTALIVAALFAGSAPAAQAGGVAEVKERISAERKMKITIGQHVFSATLQENETAAAFRALLPLTLEMHDVNENEKAFDLPARLPSDDVAPRAIRAGDIMLWSSRTMVVFYQSFSTSYRYTRIGRVDEPKDLVAALGAGDVIVKIELQ